MDARPVSRSQDEALFDAVLEEVAQPCDLGFFFVGDRNGLVAALEQARIPGLLRRPMAESAWLRL